MSRRRRSSTATNTRGRGNGEAHGVVEMMKLMTKLQNGNHNAPPPGGNDNGPNPQGTGDQATWLNLREKFVRLKPPQFEGSTNPLVVDKWKEDIDKIFMSIKCTPIQRQQLVVNTLTYAQFCERFDARYFPATVRRKKIKEFADLEQVYLQYFGHFMTPDDDKSFRKFENGLGGHIRGKVINHCFPTFQQVMDGARATEADWLRNREAKHRTSSIGRQ
ncbi:hypothetical protein MKX01_014255 [Papaver californicum]|nr:hypothetical protein MKX01_014255 [Papaver californicum]